MEGVVCKFGHKVGLQHNLSSTGKWIDKQGQQDIEGIFEDVCGASVEEIGGVPIFG